jgi:glycogen debranching enzyme
MEALAFKSRFISNFWNPDGSFIHLALDGKRTPCAVKASNMGHCLWSQILTPDQATDVASHLMSDAMFSGFGVRTLADTESAYNPLSYHNGSVWPHDNSLIMEGLRLYGMTAHLERMAQGFMDILETSEDFRLPELFCGFRKRGDSPPVPYEVACKPQAWAAGSIFLMLKSMVGLSMDTDQNYVVFHSPVLPPKVGSLEIKSLRGRDWEIDVVLRRVRVGTTVEVTKKSGSVRVLTVK